MVTYLTSISDEWGVFLIRPLLFCVVTEFLWVWHTPCCLYVGIFCCIHISHAVFVGSFFYASCYFIREVSLIHPMLFLCRVPCTVVVFLYMTCAALCWEFLWYAPCCSVWGVSCTCLCYLFIYLEIFSDMPYAGGWAWGWRGYGVLMHAPSCSFI